MLDKVISFFNACRIIYILLCSCLFYGMDTHRKTATGTIIKILREVCDMKEASDMPARRIIPPANV